MVQLSPLYMTTGKTIALTMWTFVNKVMSLLFNKAQLHFFLKHTFQVLPCSFFSGKADCLMCDVQDLRCTAGPVLTVQSSTRTLRDCY